MCQATLKKDQFHKTNAAGGCPGAFDSPLFREYCTEVGIDLYNHPAWSPDLAPIENVWNVGEQHIDDIAWAERRWRHGAKRCKANYEAWLHVVLKGVRKVRRSYYGELIDEMPDRIDELIEKKGWKIKW